MLRIIQGPANDTIRLVEEDVFCREVVERGPSEVPPGGVVIEALDELGRIRWTAYYSSYDRLVELARELSPR